MTMSTASRSGQAARPSFWAGLKSMHAIWRQRQALKTLDARALNDIGVSRAEAEAEASRPMWDAPETWLR